MLNKRIIINLVLLATTIISVVLLFNYKNFLSSRETEDILDTPVIYNNVFIDNLAVGGLTKEQAIDKLNKEKQEDVYSTKTINIRTADNFYSRNISTDELGFYHDFDAAVEEAYNYGREGSLSERQAVVDELENAGHFITSSYYYDEEQISDLLKSFEGEINDYLVETENKVDMDRLIDTVLEFVEINEFDVSIIVPVL